MEELLSYQQSKNINKNCNSSLTTQVVDIPMLTEQSKVAMFELYFQYYESTSQDLFLSDLSSKDQVIVLYDNVGILRGFSTLKLLARQVNGQPCQIIFSGDTIIHHSFWGKQALAFSWLRRAGEIKAEQPGIPLYYLLIVKGHRTYRYLQAFTYNYYPHWQDITPQSTQDLMHKLGEKLFPQYYQQGSGLIQFPVSHGHLRPEWAEPPQETLSRPEVNYFLNKNPGYRQGDELLCFTELSTENFRPLARRLFEAGMNT